MWLQRVSMCLLFNYPPVISSDARSTCPCRLFVLFVVVGVDVGLLSLLLQDLSKFVFANATKERSHFMRFLDHPLQTVTTALSDDSQRPPVTVIIHSVLIWQQSRSQWVCLDMTDLSNLYWVLCGSSSVVLNFELLHKLFKPTDRDKHVIHMIHLSKQKIYSP